MNDVIQWLNQNSSAGMVILTSIYVLATVIMTILMLLSIKLGRRQLNQTLKIEESRSRPYLIFDIQYHNQCMHAILRNDGATSARNVQVKIDPELKSDSLGNKPCTLTNHEISLIAPKREIIDFIDVSYKFYKNYTSPIFTGNIKYQDIYLNKYQEDFEINLEYDKNRSTLAEVQTSKEIEKLRKESEKIRRLLEKTVKVISSFTPKSKE